MKSMILLSLDLLKRLDGCLVQLFSGEIYRISEEQLIKQEVRLIAGEVMYLDMQVKEALIVTQYQQILRLYSPAQELVAERSEKQDSLVPTESGLQQLLPESVDDLDLYSLALTRPAQYKFIKNLRGYLGYYKKIDLSWYFNS